MSASPLLPPQVGFHSADRSLAGVTKRITVFRHAQSEYNAYTRAPWTLLTCRCCCDPHLPDPALSPHGVSQAQQVAAELAASRFLETAQVHAIVVSPFSRALATCATLFPSPPVPVVVTPLHRELSDTSSDIGSAPALLAQRFPAWADQLSQLSADWWATDGNRDIHVESDASVQQRLHDFSAWCCRRPEQHLVVVGHGHFFAAWTRQSRLDNVGSWSFQLVAQ